MKKLISIIAVAIAMFTLSAKTIEREYYLPNGQHITVFKYTEKEEFPFDMIENIQDTKHQTYWYGFNEPQPHRCYSEYRYVFKYADIKSVKYEIAYYNKITNTWFRTKR